ncbi:MAG TPA: aminotransferase class IV [Clostridia bacterium]
MIIVNGTADNGENVIIDNGFYFGRGVFETILVKQKPIFLKEHLQRLNNGLSVLGINKYVSEEYVLESIHQHKIYDCVLKLIATEKNLVISTRQSSYKPDDYLRGFKLTTSDLKRNPYSHTTYIKSLNYTDNLLEKEKASREGFDEAIFLNVHGMVAEGCTSNIFFVREDKIYTPSIECGILDGMVRKWIMQNFQIHEGQFSLEDIYASDEIFITNSIVGIMKVCSVNHITFHNTSVFERVRNKYEEFIS